jgi:outer membrane protein TolC
MNSQFLKGGACLCLCLLAAAVASAQAPPPPYQPPSMRFEATGITLFDAVRLTLQHDPNIKLRETDTEYSRGALRSEKGLFDWVLGASGKYSHDQVAITDGVTLAQLASVGAAPEDQWTEQGALNLNVAKLFRTGINLTPYADLSYNAQGYVDTDADGLYTGKVGFDIVLPLLRGSGRTSVAAAEIAATHDLEASRLALLHQQSQSVYSTIQAYWEARSLVDQVEVLQRAVQIEGQLGDITRALIAANEKPRSEEARVQAAIADARSQYEAAQRQLVDARVTLAQTMGVALADALALPLTTDPFPQVPEGLQIDPQTYPAFIAESVARRFDRQAALKSEASGKALVAGARIDTRSLLNVTAGGWGTGAHVKTPSFERWVFRSGTVGAEFQAPFGNNAARGVLERRVATLNQTSINSANLARQIGLNVIQFAESLRVAAERLRAAREAVRNYDQTIVDEQVRFKAGDSSLVDAILTEQQTTSARLSLVAAQLEYATLIAALRYESALLVRDGSVEASQLVAIPAALLRR